MNVNSPQAESAPTRKPTIPTMPDGQQCAILLCLLVQSREKELGKELIRLRLAPLTLRRLWGRDRLQEDFLREVNEWLARAGWTLFSAGGTYGILKIKIVRGWARVSSSRLRAEIQEVLNGQFDFRPHYDLLSSGPSSDAEED